MPHVLVDQSCPKQTLTISQGKDTNKRAAESNIEEQVID